MSNYLDNKIDDLAELTMKMKHYFQGEHFKTKLKTDLKLRWKMEAKLRMQAKLQAKLKFNNNNLSQEGRSSLQTEALLFISKHENCSMKELADHLSISMSSATQLVERLTYDKLVVRSDDEMDRRIIRISITDLGKAELENCMFFVREKMRMLFKNLTEKDIDDFIRIVNKIIGNTKIE